MERPRNKVYGAIWVILMMLWFVPGSFFYNSLDPVIIGLPFSVFWVLVFVPILLIINAFAWARYQMKIDDMESAAETK